MKIYVKIIKPHSETHHPLNNKLNNDLISSIM